MNTLSFRKVATPLYLEPRKHMITGSQERILWKQIKMIKIIHIRFYKNMSNIKYLLVNSEHQTGSTSNGYKDPDLNFDPTEMTPINIKRKPIMIIIILNIRKVASQ